MMKNKLELNPPNKNNYFSHSVGSKGRLCVLFFVLCTLLMFIFSNWKFSIQFLGMSILVIAVFIYIVVEWTEKIIPGKDSLVISRGVGFLFYSREMLWKNVTLVSLRRNWFSGTISFRLIAHEKTSQNPELSVEFDTSTANWQGLLKICVQKCPQASLDSRISQEIKHY